MQVGSTPSHRLLSPPPLTPPRHAPRILEPIPHSHPPTPGPLLGHRALPPRQDRAGAVPHWAAPGLTAAVHSGQQLRRVRGPHRGGPGLRHGAGRGGGGGGGAGGGGGEGGGGGGGGGGSGGGGGEGGAGVGTERHTFRYKHGPLFACGLACTVSTFSLYAFLAHAYRTAHIHAGHAVHRRGAVGRAACGGGGH